MTRHPRLETKRGTLWDDAASRSSDPKTSHLAAANLTASGKLIGRKMQVWSALRDLPNATAGELGERMGWHSGEVLKRLHDLVECGWAERGPERECKVKGSQMTTWYAYTKRACLMAAA